MHLEQLEHLRAEPTLMESAIEEVLRFSGPQHVTNPRYASVDVTLHGVTIPKGSTVYSLLGAANYDPEVFVNPEVFDIDITRSPNRHLSFSFGRGIHHCLGASLAHMETKIALNALLEAIRICVWLSHQKNRTCGKTRLASVQEYACYIGLNSKGGNHKTN